MFHRTETLSKTNISTGTLGKDCFSNHPVYLIEPNISCAQSWIQGVAQRPRNSGPDAEEIRPRRNAYKASRLIELVCPVRRLAVRFQEAV